MTLSLESQKLSIQVLHVSTSLGELSQKFQLTLTSHQWLWRRWRLYWHLLPLISTLGVCWYGPDLPPHSRVSQVFSCAKIVRKRISATDRPRGINTGQVDQWVFPQEGGFSMDPPQKPQESCSSWMKWMSWSENQWQLLAYEFDNPSWCEVLWKAFIIFK